MLILGEDFRFTLNSLGTMSLGVSTPTSASTQQKIRIAKIMAKSLMSFLTYRDQINEHKQTSNNIFMSCHVMTGDRFSSHS